MKLVAHPDHVPLSVTSVDVALERESEGTLRLTFLVAGAHDLLLPLPAKPERADGLWQHTCFELFARPPAGTGYVEFNFAPSTAWAAYRLEDYRTGMSDLPVSPPVIEGRRGEDSYVLGARLQVPGLAPGWRLALSAVIEEHNGARSFWALAHPPGKPDFHHPDCFALELPAPLAP